MIPSPTVRLAAALIGGLLLSGCAHHTAPTRAVPAPSSLITMPIPPALPPGRSGHPAGGLPNPAAVDAADPSAVSRAALVATWSSDTTIDTSPHDAALRAAPYLTAQYLTQLQATPPRADPGASWAAWVTHRAHTRVTLRAEHDDPPIDTPTVAHRQWSVTAAPIGRDGWHGLAVRVTCFVTLTQAAGRWLVAGITVSS